MKVKGESFSSENDSFIRLLTLSKPGIHLFFATIIVIFLRFLRGWRSKSGKQIFRNQDFSAHVAPLQVSLLSETNNNVN